MRDLFFFFPMKAIGETITIRFPLLDHLLSGSLEEVGVKYLEKWRPSHLGIVVQVNVDRGRGEIRAAPDRQSDQQHRSTDRQQQHRD